MPLRSGRRLKILSVITMSSTDKLEASVAGECSSATRKNSCSNSSTLRFSVSVKA